jgi:hypothetical protein
VRAEGSEAAKGAGGAQHPAAMAASGKANRVRIHCRNGDRDRAMAVDRASGWRMILSALPDELRQVAQATMRLSRQALG